MRLDIRYRMHFQYSEAVWESQNEVRVRPRDDETQRVLSSWLTPKPLVRVFGAVSELVLAVEAEVRRALAYEADTTDIGVSLAELLEGGAGVCQDFAHLAIGMLRSVGVPARYVSGYLFAADETVLDAEVADIVSVQTHAWVEAAVPGAGWHAFDPTNGTAVGERHVVIGCGRDYDDVPPVRGTFMGSATADVDAEVVIGRHAAEAAEVVADHHSRPRILAYDDPAKRHEHQQQQQQQ